MRLKPAQIIIELVVALAVAMVAIVALIQNTTKSVSNSTFSKSQTTANEYATEAIEWLRSEKNKSWPDLYNESDPLGYLYKNGGIYCLSSLSWTSPGVCNPINYIPSTNFLRQLNYNSSTKQLTVKVTWTETNKDISITQVISFGKY